MDIVHLLKKALVFGFASLALLPPVLLFAFDIGKWLAALPGLFWLAFGIFIGLFSFLWLYPRLNPAGNREAQALLAKARAGDMDAQFALATACMELLVTARLRGHFTGISRRLIRGIARLLSKQQKN